MTLFKIISALAEEPSTNAKSKILLDNKDNVDLKTYFECTLNPFKNYFIRVKELPKTSSDSNLDSFVMNDVCDMLCGRIVTGHSARDYLNSVLIELSLENQILLQNMINHDANCKVAEGLVNKCWPGLIPKFPVMLAEEFNEKTAKYIPEGKDAIFIQKKEDGGRSAIVVSYSGEVTVYSRGGNILEMHGVLDFFSNFPGQVFDGELLVIDENGIQDRKTGNGYFNRAVRNTITKEQAQMFHVCLWDVIPLDKWKSGFDETPYSTRFENLNKNEYPKNVSIVESERVSTHEQAQTFYLRMLTKKFEGAMIKRADAPWEDRRSRNVLKLKETKDATLICRGVQPHSKNPNWIGSLECETSCGKLHVSVGSGLTEEDRKKKPEEFIDKLIAVKYNMLIDNKNNATHSMFLPRYDYIRTDVKQADTLDHLK
jgi:ATP-dependent DNA ligase